MRKINHYFQRFKLNACFEEIKTWRNLYTSTVKGKKLIEVSDKLSQVNVYDSFKIIQ